MSLFTKIFLQEQTMGDISVATKAQDSSNTIDDSSNIDSFDPTLPVTLDAKPFPVPNGNLVDHITEEALHSKVVEPFSGEHYAELGAIIGMLEGMSVLFQTLHWQVNGKSFYGDHLMFQRIYEATDGQIDGLAEKAVGLGRGALVNPDKITKVMDIFLDHVRSHSDIEVENVGYSYAKRGKYAIEVFVETVEHMMLDIKDKGLMTKGLDNMLAGILDEQEGNIFLLKQRVLAGV